MIFESGARRANVSVGKVEIEQTAVRILVRSFVISEKVSDANLKNELWIRDGERSCGSAEEKARGMGESSARGPASRLGSMQVRFDRADRDV